MRREDRPDPGISLGGQSAVVNKFQDPRQIGGPGKDADRIIEGHAEQTAGNATERGSINLKS
jgi:hypothetical protein